MIRNLSLYVAKQSIIEQVYIRNIMYYVSTSRSRDSLLKSNNLAVEVLQFQTKDVQ